MQSDLARKSLSLHALMSHEIDKLVTQEDRRRVERQLARGLRWGTISPEAARDLYWQLARARKKSQ